MSKQKMLTQTVKIEIVKPINIDWKILKDILKDLSKETREILNKTIQYNWEYQYFSSDYKDKYGIYPSKEEVLNYKRLSGFIYDQLKEKYNKLYTVNLSTTIQLACKKWSDDFKDILTGEKSIPSYKKDQPIDLYNKSIKIIKDKTGYYADLKIISTAYKKEKGLPSTSVMVLLGAKDKYIKEILSKIIDGEYKINASQIVLHKKRNKPKWMLHLVYSFPKKDVKLDKNKVMGIDMGVVYPIYMAFNHTLSHHYIIGGEIEEFRRRIEKRKRSLQLQGKYCGVGRRGRGRKTRLQPVEKIGKIISKFRDTTNHKYSVYVVKIAKKYGCGVIQMEDLEGISKDDAFLKNWSYYDLQLKIKYKAEREGIEVRFIDPKYTSQRCSKCGYISENNRKQRDIFECQQCGTKMNADLNAARNIATPGIEEIIKKQLQKQKQMVNSDVIEDYYESE